MKLRSSGARDRYTHANKFKAGEAPGRGRVHGGVPEVVVVLGVCPVGTIPVYRLGNQRVDSNHRYTTSAAIRTSMG